MDRYVENTNNSMSRVNRNKNSYNDSNLNDLSRIRTNNNVSVLIDDAPKEININKIKSYINSMNEAEENSERVSLELPKYEEEEIKRQETKDYDIHSILEHAKDNRQSDYETERHRKFDNTEYDILKNLNLDEKNNVEENNTIIEDDLNTQEKTIVDLIKNIQSKPKVQEDNIDDKDDLFGSLMSDNENTVIIPPINEVDENRQVMKKELEDMTQDLESIIKPVNDLTQELIIEKEKLKQLDQEEREARSKEEGPQISKMNIDKSFYTNSLTFSKEDFEGFEDLENSSEKSTFTKIAIVVIVLILLAITFLIVNYVFDLNII